MWPLPVKRMPTTGLSNSQVCIVSETYFIPRNLWISGSVWVFVLAGGTLSATRASSRASSRSGCTSGTLEAESSTGSRRASRRTGVAVSASRAGAARTAAILLISRHLAAVRRDGGAHPPRCAAKGDLDDVCSAGPVICTTRCSAGWGRSYHSSKAHCPFYLYLTNCQRFLLGPLQNHLKLMKNHETNLLQLPLQRIWYIINK